MPKPLNLPRNAARDFVLLLVTKKILFPNDPHGQRRLCNTDIQTHVPLLRSSSIALSTPGIRSLPSHRTPGIHALKLESCH